VPVAKGETIDVERTRAKLVRAAAELFYEAGVPTTGINEISARAGVGKQTLYQHFGSKDGLLEAVLSERSDRVVRWLREAATAPADPRERVLAVFDALRGWYAEQTFRGCAIVGAATQQPDPHGPARRIAAAHLARHRELLTTLAGEAGVPDPRATGRRLLILLEGATVVAALTGDPSAGDDARAIAAALLGR
jgi:AcrR family transcriptional regulator